MFKTLIVLLLLSVVSNAQISKLSDAIVEDIHGKEISFKKFEGKCVLAINTASQCGFTGEWALASVASDSEVPNKVETGKSVSLKKFESKLN